jgi:hypothetical protein
MARPPRPTSTNPEDYPAWRAYIADFTGLSGSRLTQATREAISSERAKSNDGGGGTGDGDGTGGGSDTPDPQTGPGQERDPQRPGQAWMWDGSKWVRPPSPGPAFSWDDAEGWTRDTEGETTAKASLVADLERYGLGELARLIDGYITRFGVNEVLIMNELRKSELYKQRFAGIEKRIQAGYSAINEATYIAMEDEYKKVMRSYGLDSSFYDRGRLAELIGFDVSEAEVESRIATGQRIMQSANQSVLRELQEYYPEITNGDILSYLLDPKAGQEVLSKKIRTGMIGGTAEQAGFTMDLERSQRLARTSIGQTLDPFDVRTQAQLEQTFGTARETARTERTLAGIDREAYTEMDTLEAAFGDTEKQLASQRRGERERARFAGESGVGRSSLSRRSRRAL